MAKESKIQKMDSAFDKKMGIKEGGKKDNAIHKAAGIPPYKGKKK